MDFATFAAAAEDDEDDDVVTEVVGVRATVSVLTVWLLVDGLVLADFRAAAAAASAAFSAAASSFFTSDVTVVDVVAPSGTSPDIHAPAVASAFAAETAAAFAAASAAALVATASAPVPIVVVVVVVVVVSGWPFLPPVTFFLTTVFDFVPSGQPSVLSSQGAALAATAGTTTIPAARPAVTAARVAFFARGLTAAPSSSSPDFTAPASSTPRPSPEIRMDLGCDSCDLWVLSDGWDCQENGAERDLNICQAER